MKQALRGVKALFERSGVVYLAFFMNCFFPDTVNCVASYALVSYLPFYVLSIPLHLSC